MTDGIAVGMSSEIQLTYDPLTTLIEGAVTQITQ